MKKSERRMLLQFLSPIIIIFLLIFAYPTLRTIYMSFFKVKNLAQNASDWSFVGLKNYADAFSDPLFIKSFVNVLFIGVVGGLAVFLIALFFAVTLCAKIKGKRALRAIVYLPNIITPVAMITMWTNYIYNNEYGLFHNFFSFLHMDTLAALPWNSAEWAFRSMMIAFCFGSVGYYMVILLSAMEKIPDDFYDYAALEGAKKLYIFRRITLPLLVDTMRTAIIFWSIGAVNFFLWSRLFTTEPLQPSLIVPMNLMFSYVFGGGGGSSAVKLNVGGGCAIGVMITFTIVILFALINNIGSKEHYEY